MSRPFTENLSRRGALAILVILVLAAHGLSLGNGHVWDDPIVILTNHVVNGNPSDLLFSIDSGRATETTPYYRPLTLATFMLEGRLHSFSPVLMHGVNLLLHAGSVLILFRVMTGLGLSTVASLAGSILLAVHPLTVEPVSFLSGGRNTLLSALFVLLATHFFLRWRESGRRTDLAGSVFSFFCGLFAKETTLALLPLLGWMEMKRKGWRGLLYVVPHALAAASYLIFRSVALGRAGVSTPLADDIPRLAGSVLFIVPRTLLNLLAPLSLSPRYHLPDDLNLYALGILAGWILLAVVVTILVRSGRPLVRLGLLWALLFWIPTSGIVPIPSAPMADRYLYLSVAGVAIVVADLVSAAEGRGWFRSRWPWGGAIILTILMTGLSLRQTLVWKSDETLFTRLVQISPDQAYGYHNLGCYYLDVKRDLDRAEEMFGEAAKRDPLFPRLHTQLGFIRFLRGDLAGAIREYDWALAQNPFDGEALVKRGEAMELTGNREEAVEMYRRFLSLPVSEIPWARPVVEERLKVLTAR